MARAVLDASAVLAVLNNEPGMQETLPFLEDAMLSAVNYAEVASKLLDKGLATTQMRGLVVSLGLRIEDFDIALAERAGELRPLTRHRGLSLGDRACIALAEREGAPAVTADANWLDAIAGVDIRLIR